MENYKNPSCRSYCPQIQLLTQCLYITKERGVLVSKIVRHCQQQSDSGLRTTFTQMIILNLLIKTETLLIATAAFQVHNVAQAINSR